MAVAKARPSALLDVFKTIDFSPARGDGVWLTGQRGERYLDFYGGHAVALLGYGHGELLEAARRQAAELFFQSNAVPLAVRERAARALVRFGPKGLDKVFFVNSGAEANENALRIAFLATRRKRVVAVRGAFHGRTAAAGAITDGASWYAFPRRPFAVTTVPFDDAPALERAIGDDVAAVIFEPVQGMAGARPLSLEFAQTARRLTSERGAVLIFDEVQCGMGRSGHPFVAQAWGVTPDLLTTAKGVAGGYPVGAVMVAGPLAEKVGTGQLGTTFGGGPVACALVETVVGVVKGLLGKVRSLSRRLMRECLVGPVEAVQGMGLLLGLRTRRPAAEVLAELRARRILAGGSADPHVVRLLPPLTLQDEHVDALVSALKEIKR